MNMVQTETATTAITCQECNKDIAVYACPRCRRRTCSLACCRSHKVRQSCNGKRDLTAFAPLSRMTDATIQSDYHFLESVLGTLESGRKLVQQHGDHAATSGSGRSYNHKRQRIEPSAPTLPPAWLLENSEIRQQQSQSSNMNAKQRHFVQQAAQRGVTVLVQPSFMQRHQQNKSHVTKQGDFHWTIEWRIYYKGCKNNVHDSPETSRTCHTLFKDTTMVQDAFEQCMTTLSGNASSLSSKMSKNNLSSFRLLLKRIPCPANQPLYSELSRTVSVASCLQDRTVIEYPTIDVVHTDCLNDFPLLLQHMDHDRMTIGKDELEEAMKAVAN